MKRVFLKMVVSVQKLSFWKWEEIYEMFLFGNWSKVTKNLFSETLVNVGKVSF